MFDHIFFCVSRASKQYHINDVSVSVFDTAFCDAIVAIYMGWSPEKSKIDRLTTITQPIYEYCLQGICIHKETMSHAPKNIMCLKNESRVIECLSALLMSWQFCIRQIVKSVLFSSLLKLLNGYIE